MVRQKARLDPVVLIGRALAALLLWGAATPGAGADTWLTGIDRYSQGRNPASASYMELFAPGAQWGADGVQVFKTSTQFLMRAPDGEISEMIRALRDRRIALSFESLTLVGSDRCGSGIEGYEGPRAIPTVADRVKRLGGQIAYVAMDEHLAFGHFSDRKNACQDSIASLADQLAPNVRALRAAFPDVKFGDIEPLDPRTAGRLDTMLDFAKAFKEATGEPLSFYHADINWRSDWYGQLATWKRRLHAAGIRLGVIFNGDPRATSDAEWADHVIERYRMVMSDPAVSPDDAIFQSWTVRPTKLLPDTDPNALTGVVRRAR